MPEANLLGERGRGFANFLHILDEGRIAIAALSTGAAEGCLEAAVDYAKKRTVFGEALSTRQGIQFMLARMRAARAQRPPRLAPRGAPARRRQAVQGSRRRSPS